MIEAEDVADDLFQASKYGPADLRAEAARLHKVLMATLPPLDEAMMAAVCAAAQEFISVSAAAIRSPHAAEQALRHQLAQLSAVL